MVVVGVTDGTTGAHHYITPRHGTAIVTGSTTGTTNTSRTRSDSSTTGTTGTNTGTTGIKRTSLLDIINPYVDSNGDGEAGFVENQLQEVRNI